MGVIGKIIKGIVKIIPRLIDNVFTGGLVYNVLEKTELKADNKNIVNESKRGTLDKPKWFSMFILLLPLWLIIALKMGWLTWEEIDFLLTSFNPE